MNKKRPEGDETEYWPRLQHCYINSNKISAFTVINAPKLLILDLSHNEISTIPETDDGFKGHENLEWLDLSRNKLTSLAMIRGMPNLKTFYASANTNIRKLNGLEECPKLELIHLRANSVILHFTSDFLSRNAARQFPISEVSEPERERHIQD